MAFRGERLNTAVSIFLGGARVQLHNKTVTYRANLALDLIVLDIILTKRMCVCVYKEKQRRNNKTQEEIGE